MLYQIQVKADNQRVYRKLSVKMRSIDAIDNVDNRFLNEAI